MSSGKVSGSKRKAPVEADDQSPEKRQKHAIPDSESQTPLALQDVMPPIPSGSSSSSSSALVVPPPKTVAVPMAQGRLSRLLGAVVLSADTIKPVDVLMRPMDPKIVSPQAMAHLQEMYLHKLLYSIEQDPNYFKKLKGAALDTAGTSLKLRDHPTNADVPYRVGSLSRGGPLIRTPLLMGYHGTPKITPQAGKDAKAMFQKAPAASSDSKEKKSGGSANDANSYFIEPQVLRGNNEMAVEQRDFLEFLRTDVARFALVMICKEKDTSWDTRVPICQALLRNDKKNWKGAYNDMDSVPHDHPELVKAVADCLQQGSLMVMNHGLKNGVERVPAFTFKKQADKGWGAKKEEWAPLDISYVYVDDKGKLVTMQLFDEPTIDSCLKKAPYTIDFRFKPNFDKNKESVNFALQIETVRFYPQLYMIVDPLLRATAERTEELTQQDIDALDQAEANYRAKKGLPLAIAHHQQQSNGDMNIRCDTSQLD